MTCRRSKHKVRNNTRGQILAILLLKRTLHSGGWSALRSGHSHATYEMSLDPMIEFFFLLACRITPEEKAARGTSQRSCRGDHCLWPKMPERGNHGDGPEVERSRPSAMIDFTLGPPPLGRLRYGEIRRQMGRRPEAGEEKTRDDWKAFGYRLSIEINQRLISLNIGHLPTKTKRFESERRDGALASGRRDDSGTRAGAVRGWPGKGL